MITTRPSLIGRPDTFLGVCAGIGEDVGFNPDWLRVALAAVLFVNPLAAFGAYAALGLVVLASRLIVREPSVAAAALPAAANAADDSAATLPLAA